MPGPLSLSFPRRRHTHGPTDLICPICFRTVLQSRCEQELAQAELLHHCDREALTHINVARKNISRQATGHK